MAHGAAIFYAVACLGVIAFQMALIAGAPWGALTQGGRVTGPVDQRGRLAAFVSIFILGAMASAVLSVAGLPPRWPSWTIWPALAVQTLSTLANWVTPSAPERRLGAPVTTAMLALAIAAASL